MTNTAKPSSQNAPQAGVTGAGADAGAQPGLVLVSIEGGVWACAPVSERPELVLTDWRVFEVLLPGSTERTRHFVGYNTSDREGRVSSAIVKFDPAAMCGVTKSDRVYELRGRSGWNGDADYTWNRWKRINSATDALDVTAQINALLANPR